MCNEFSGTQTGLKGFGTLMPTDPDVGINAPMSSSMIRYYLPSQKSLKKVVRQPLAPPVIIGVHHSTTLTTCLQNYETMLHYKPVAQDYTVLASRRWSQSLRSPKKRTPELSKFLEGMRDRDGGNDYHVHPIVLKCDIMTFSTLHCLLMAFYGPRRAMSWREPTPHTSLSRTFQAHLPHLPGSNTPSEHHKAPTSTPQLSPFDLEGRRVSPLQPAVPFLSPTPEPTARPTRGQPANMWLLDACCFHHYLPLPTAYCSGEVSDVQGPAWPGCPGMGPAWDGSGSIFPEPKPKPAQAEPKPKTRAYQSSSIKLLSRFSALLGVLLLTRWDSGV
ncbi:hypothetical protein FB45DRAFT_883352 [Roridomyces roridus]|uniref:Uncharacterized protein n=1 Tax=Roridomyces roridus TaxID=1738132 RepID=A0AAD7AXB9_9AGAR|nr:hypothetical protein FB45DRAFT_883352 [Roridomyces roridus]